MKTGFTCSAGFNIVAAARRGNRRLITVVMGAPSSGARTAMATVLFDRGFASTSPIGSVSTLNGFATSEPPDMHGKACYGRSRATREYMAAVQRVRVAAMPSGSAPGEAAAPERVSLLDNARKKGKAAMNAAADGVRAGLATVAVYVGRAPGWSGPVAQVRPANTPVGTPSPVTAYAPEVKPTVLAGSAPPIAASAADALPMRRPAAPAAKPSAKAVAAAREDADPDADAGPKVKRPAKHAKAAHHRQHVRTTDGRHGGKHKRVAAAKPLAEGDGGGKSSAPAHSGRRPEGE
jgi:D-alanyl-D-alanine carboxypeptidase